MRLTGNLRRKILYQELFDLLRAYDPATVKEVSFNKIMNTKRLFRADFFCPNLSLIVEVNGGQFINGRHTRGGKGYENDLEKLNLAQANGFNVLQFTYQMLERGEHCKIILKYCQSVC